MITKPSFIVNSSNQLLETDGDELNFKALLEHVLYAVLQ